MGYYVNSNPNNGNFSIISTNIEKYQVRLFSITGQIIQEKSGIGVLEINNIPTSGIYLLSILKEGRTIGKTKIIVK